MVSNTIRPTSLARFPSNKTRVRTSMFIPEVGEGKFLYNLGSSSGRDRNRASDCFCNKLTDTLGLTSTCPYCLDRRRRIKPATQWAISYARRGEINRQRSQAIVTAGDGWQTPAIFDCSSRRSKPLLWEQAHFAIFAGDQNSPGWAFQIAPSVSLA